jgi:acyl-CoA synthetase (AMP-forming)/AMP-acid ligase II
MSVSSTLRPVALPAPPARPATLVELFRARADEQPQLRVLTYLRDGEEEQASLTYAELDGAARSIAALLQRHCRPGDRALLLYPPGLEFVTAFLGCLYAGVMAVPAYPPRAARLQRTLPKLQAISDDARPAVVLTTAEVSAAVGKLGDEVAPLRTMHWLATDDSAGHAPDEWQEPAIGADTLAFLQYTSGSTATPKGVMVTHGHLLHNSAYLASTFQLTPESTLVSWLPTFHDMGLIFGILQPLYTGFGCYVMAPAAFIQRPLRWLAAMSRYGGTHTVAPNFAYELCARKITPEQRAALNLSQWRVAVNGAEPLHKETLDRFAATFAACGFQNKAFYPGYGLAEATLLVSGGRTPAEEEYVTCTVETAALEQHRIVVAAGPAGEARTETRTLVSSGQAQGDVSVAIVHPETLQPCAADEVGEIWVSSPSLARGYWQRPEETERTFRAYPADKSGGPYLRTGDLGFLRAGYLYITGRIKDLIIIGGLNHYPQDIEFTAEQSHPCFRPGFSAAFSIEVEGAERLIVVLEVGRRYSPAPDKAESAPEAGAPPPRQVSAQELITAVRRAVAEVHELQVHQVVLLKAGSILKTSSGKIERQACRRNFLAGTLDLWQA